jgi:hypothetical protein
LAKSNWNKKSDAVKLSSIRSLTLRDGAYTSNRRVGAIPQLECVGGNAKGLYHVDVMQCYNTGGEYGAEDIQWSCKAQLPPEFKLGSTDVICEGYDSPDDPFVLKGSCGVEYRLILTPVGEVSDQKTTGRGDLEFSRLVVSLQAVLMRGRKNMDYLNRAGSREATVVDGAILVTMTPAAANWPPTCFGPSSWLFSA